MAVLKLLCYCFSRWTIPPVFLFFIHFVSIFSPLLFHWSHRDIENVKFVCFLSLMLKVFAAAADNAMCRVPHPIRPPLRFPFLVSNFIWWHVRGPSYYYSLSICLHCSPHCCSLSQSCLRGYTNVFLCVSSYPKNKEL